MPALSVSKSITIQAPVDRVYEVVRDFKLWPKWSPWIIIEPDCPLTFSEDGKAYNWEGKIIGSGGMSITDETPRSRIDYDLRFVRPWKSQADVSFLFQEKEGGTEVTWKMESSLPFIMFFMKKMMTAFIGMDYERGLRMMRDYIETGAVPSRLAFGEASHDSFSVVGIRRKCAIDEIGPTMGEDFERMKKWVGESCGEASAAEPSGAPLSFYHKWDMVNRRTEYTIGFPVSNVPDSLPEGFVSVLVPAIDTYTVTHTGLYEHLGNAWSAGMMRSRSGEFKQGKTCAPFEIYATDPAETPPEELVTIVNFPKKP